MNTITINSHEYDAMTYGNRIQLESVDRDLIYEGGYLEMRRMAELEYWKMPIEYIENTPFKDFLSEYLEENIEQWCNENQEKAIEIVHHNN